MRIARIESTLFICTNLHKVYRVLDGPNAGRTFCPRCLSEKNEADMEDVLKNLLVF